MATLTNILSDAVHAQLMEIPAYPDYSRRCVYRPASAECADGRSLPRVVFVDCRAMGRRPRVGGLGFAIWPSEIRVVTPSPEAVPLDLYQSTVGLPEIAMGAKRAGMTLRDGRRFAIGFADEFPLFPLPPGAVGADIENIEALYTEGDDRWGDWRGTPATPRVWVCEHL